MTFGISFIQSHCVGLLYAMAISSVTHCPHQRVTKAAKNVTEASQNAGGTIWAASERQQDSEKGGWRCQSLLPAHPGVLDELPCCPQDGKGLPAKMWHCLPCTETTLNDSACSDTGHWGSALVIAPAVLRGASGTHTPPTWAVAVRSRCIYPT
jgi:hypothetical protein